MSYHGCPDPESTENSATTEPKRAKDLDEAWTLKVDWIYGIRTGCLFGRAVAEHAEVPSSQRAARGRARRERDRRAVVVERDGRRAHVGDRDRHGLGRRSGSKERERRQDDTRASEMHHHGEGEIDYSFRACASLRAASENEGMDGRRLCSEEGQGAFKEGQRSVESARTIAIAPPSSQMLSSHACQMEAFGWFCIALFKRYKLVRRPLCTLTGQSRTGQQAVVAGGGGA